MKHLKRACLIIALIAFGQSAHASFKICNRGETSKVQVALASRVSSIFDKAWSLTAWKTIEPGDCESFGSGSIDGYEFAIHAEARGTTLTSEFAGDESHDVTYNFCLTNAAMHRDESMRSVSSADQCADGEFLRAFPIGYVTIYDYGMVNLYPDKVVGSASASSENRGEHLPAYFGVVVSQKSGGFYVSSNHTGREAAVQNARRYCEKNGKADEECEVRYEFADRCIAWVHSDKEINILAVGQYEGTEDAVKAWGLQRCAERGNEKCEVSMVICSTHESAVATREQQQLENLGKLLEMVLPPAEKSGGQ